jgi:hypothetical protein
MKSDKVQFLLLRVTYTTTFCRIIIYILLKCRTLVLASVYIFLDVKDT